MVESGRDTCLRLRVKKSFPESATVNKQKTIRLTSYLWSRDYIFYVYKLHMPLEASHN